MNQNFSTQYPLPGAPRPARARTLARLSVSVLGLIAVLGVFGCGGGAATHSDARRTATKPAGPQLVVPGPHAIVATVGSRTLTGAALTHLIDIGIGMEPASIRVPLKPPAFSACVTYLKTKGKAQGSVVPTATATHTCQSHYEEDRIAAITRWISGEWVIHGAAEAGLALSDRAVHEDYIRSIREDFKSYSEFEGYLAETGQSEADQLRSVLVTRSGERIRETITKKAEHVTEADVKNYYQAHLGNYTIPERRDLEIVRFKTKAEAARAKREIEAGRTFASLANASKLAQPIFSKDGLVRGLAPGVYSERPLDHAIFHTKPGVLGGPVKIVLGWYLFKVKATHQGRRKSFDEVADSIRAMLPKQRTEQMLAAFTSHWRAKWREKTDCSPGYVVRKCKQFKRAPGSPPEDPYTLA